MAIDYILYGRQFPFPHFAGDELRLLLLSVLPGVLLDHKGRIDEEKGGYYRYGRC